MNIDWSQLITKAMKEAAAAAARLTEAQALLKTRNESAAMQVERIQDRIETLGYGIDLGEATSDDEAEQQALLANLKHWKAYKFSLGKVAAQAVWPVAPDWPVQPAVPIIVVDPILPAASLT
ncbi:phage tail protein [Pseudomonas sp. SWRI153]|uniref:Phage tail protein n=1 Tax=Pseudomonas khorasanensis TaxID=2745508 RepID=A0A923JGJ2_9PSED|nr:phage tail protein [Pseudomonas khorasanensis]MBV4486944.1 phage tail protein [Pseudomonas khorasanensis]